jgi:hypothetical protein
MVRAMRAMYACTRRVLLTEYESPRRPIARVRTGADGIRICTRRDLKNTLRRPSGALQTVSKKGVLFAGVITRYMGVFIGKWEAHHEARRPAHPILDALHAFRLGVLVMDARSARRVRCVGLYRS